MNFTPHITVACIIERDGRFLFVREHTSRGIAINQPAGHLEAGETLQQAALRETLEETGWHVEVTALTGLYLYQAPNGVTYQRLCFAARPVQQVPDARLDSEIIEPMWLTLAELQARPEQLRSPLVTRCIQDYLAGSSYPLDILKGIF